MLLMPFLRILSILIHVVNAEFYYLSENKSNWTTANNFCISEGEKLLELSSLKKGEFLNFLNYQVPASGRLWLNERVVFSPFVFWKGCYPKRLVNESHGKLKILTVNNIFYCSKFCNANNVGWAYIGLSESTCYCFKNVNGLQQERPDIECNISCQQSDFPGEFCGDHLSMGLYGRADSLPMEISPVHVASEPTSQCLYVTGDNINSNFTYGTKDCKATTLGHICQGVFSDMLHFQCTKTLKNKEKACALINNGTWAMSSSMCKLKGGHLINVLECILNDREFYSPEVFNDYQYWTGIFRTSHMTSRDKRIQGHQCLAVDVSELNRKSINVCSDLNNFVCIFTSNQTYLLEPIYTTQNGERDNYEISTKLQINQPDFYSDKVRIVVLCVIGFLLILIVLQVMFLVLWKRRKRSSHQNDLQTCEADLNVYSTIRDSVMMTDQPDSAYTEIPNVTATEDYCHTAWNDLNTVFETRENRHAYSHVTTQSYSGSKDGPYDCLNTRTIKIHSSANKLPGNAMYDCASSTRQTDNSNNLYDHTGQQKAFMNREAGSYDHAFVSKETGNASSAATDDTDDNEIYE